jgi:hypothetical protein
MLIAASAKMGLPVSFGILVGVFLILGERMRGGTHRLEFFAIVHEDVPGLILIVMVDGLRGLYDDWTLTLRLHHLRHPLPLIVDLSQQFSSVFADHLAVVTHN